MSGYASEVERNAKGVCLCTALQRLLRTSSKTKSAVSSNNTVKPISSSSRTIGKVVLSVKDVV